MMDAATLPLESPPREPTAERWGGWLISVFFHLMLLALMWQQILPSSTPPPSEPPPVLHFTVAPAAPPEQPTIVPPTPPAPDEPTESEARPEEVRRTSDVGEQIDDIARSANPNELQGELIEHAPPAPEDAEENAAPEVGSLTESTVLMSEPDATSESAPGEDLPERDEAERRTALDEDIAALLEREITLAQADIQRQVVMRTEIQGGLWQEQEELDSSNADFVSDGQRHGSHREIDVSGVPFIIAQRVFNRYGARLENRIIDPSEIEQGQGPITVNAVTLPGGQRLTGQRVIEPGPGVILEYDQELNAFLHLLEREALAHANVNPSKVAITRSVFALDRDDLNGWGIVLRDFEFVEVE